MAIRIREAVNDDIEQLAKAFMKAWNAMGERWSIGEASEYMDYWMKKGDIFLVAETCGRIVGGFASGLKPWWSGKQLYDGELFVEPEEQGKGIGKALMLEMLKRAKRLGATEMVAFTYRNSIAHKWYSRLGMRDADEFVMVEGIIDGMLEKLGMAVVENQPPKPQKANMQSSENNENVGNSGGWI